MPTVPPPRPELIRRPTGRFGWLEDRLLRDGWLARLGPDATAVLVLLALAADRHGASFYGRERMADKLGITRQDVDQALARLRELNLVDHRPWCQGHPDGVWQLLPLPQPAQLPPCGEPVAIGHLFRSLGLPPQHDNPTQTSTPPDSRAS